MSSLSPFQSKDPNYSKYVQQVAEYLSARGLKQTYFHKGLIIKGPKELHHQYPQVAAGRPFIELEYLDPSGALQPYAGPGSEPFTLARFMDPVAPGQWFGESPPPKCVAPKGSGICAHFEPLPEDEYPNGWDGILMETPIIIVESYLKAKAITNKLGLPAIGLNGINGYYSSTAVKKFLFSRYGLAWEHMKIIVLFDSNVNDPRKPQIKQARDGLMTLLACETHCKEVYYVDLPMVKGEHVGPDDYMVVEGEEALARLLLAPQQFILEEHHDLVEEMNEMAVYDMNTNAIIDRGTKKVMSVEKARHRWSDVKKITWMGKRQVIVPGFVTWLQSKHRNEVSKAVYEYLGGEWLEDGKVYNLYMVDGYWPGPGGTLGVDLAVDHMRKMLGEKLELFRSYIKYLKFTGGKPVSFPVLFSDKRGVGKGWITSLVEAIIGESHVAALNEHQAITNFTGSLIAKRLVVAHEFSVRGDNKKAAMNMLKVFVGDAKMRVEYKGVDASYMSNSSGLLMTCNSLADIPNDTLEDRRMWYVDCDGGLSTTDDEWTALHSILKNKEDLEGIAAWFNAGENRDFATWRPPMDDDKLRATMESSDPLVAELISVRMELIAGGHDYATGPGIKGVLMKRGMGDILDRMAPRSQGVKIGSAGWVAVKGVLSKVARTSIYYAGGSESKNPQDVANLAEEGDKFLRGTDKY